MSIKEAITCSEFMEIRSGGPTWRSRGAGVPSFRPKMKTELTNQSASNMKKIEKNGLQSTISPATVRISINGWYVWNT